MEELNKFFDHYLHIMRWDKFVLEIGNGDIRTLRH